MTLMTLLEDFGTAKAKPSPSAPAAPALDDASRLAVFEDGFKAGWDDAMSAQNDDAHRISSQFAQNLQDLSFTYHEAVAHVTKSLRPILSQTVGILLPKIASRSIGPQIIEQIDTLIQSSAQPNVKILTSAEDFEAVSSLLDREVGFPVTCEVNPDLATGQAEMVFDDGEIRIDCQEALAQITALFDGFVFENERILAHG